MTSITCGLPLRQTCRPELRNYNYGDPAGRTGLIIANGEPYTFLRCSTTEGSAMAQRRKRAAARKGKQKRGKTPKKKTAKRLAVKTMPKKQAGKAKPRTAKKAAARKPRPQKQQGEVPAETVVVDTVEEAIPGVVVVTEVEATRAPDSEEE